MRYRLRTLMILLAVGPPLIAASWFAPAVILLSVVLFAACAFWLVSSLEGLE
jgi:hypothetical protein